MKEEDEQATDSPKKSLPQDCFLGIFFFRYVYIYIDIQHRSVG